jgi:hypothetical protein
VTGVAIVIPMLNDAAGLPRLLRSLAALEPPPAEVLAVMAAAPMPPSPSRRRQGCLSSDTIPVAGRRRSTVACKRSTLGIRLSQGWSGTTPTCAEPCAGAESLSRCHGRSVVAVIGARTRAPAQEMSVREAGSR